MEPLLFAKGMFAGFVIAAPMGPVGVLIAQRTLNRGVWSGLIAGSGAALADTIFGAAAAFSLTFLAMFLAENSEYLRWLGGGLLLLIGLHSIFFKKVESSSSVDESRARTINKHASDALTTFVLTITNPITIVSFSPIFAAIGAVVAPNDLAAVWTLIVGVLTGSTLWWLVLSSMVSVFRNKLNDDRLRLVNKISGGIIIVFGILVLTGLTGLQERVTTGTRLQGEITTTKAERR